MFLLLGLAAGAALGMFHFGGLWYTVRQVEPERAVGRRLVVSFVARFAVTALGFWFLARLHPLALLGALGGMLLARALIRRRVLRRDPVGA